MKPLKARGSLIAMQSGTQRHGTGWTHKKLCFAVYDPTMAEQIAQRGADILLTADFLFPSCNREHSLS